MLGYTMAKFSERFYMLSYFRNKFMCEWFCACTADQSEEGPHNCISIISILSNPRYQIILYIDFEYNLTELKPQGCCFSIDFKMYNLLLESSIGRVSPRSYVSYTYEDSKKRDSKPFLESMYISLVFSDERERTQLLQKHYQIPVHGKLPKSTKLCVVGHCMKSCLYNSSVKL